MPEPSATLKSDLIQQCPLAAILAGRLRAESSELTHRWLDRINARVEVSENRIFPSNDLLNHIPLLIVGVADYLEDPERVAHAIRSFLAPRGG